MRKKFAPLLFAGDINVYSVARAFHQAYGIVCDGYGKYPKGPCMNSRILNYRSNEKADEQETFLKLVDDFAADRKDQSILLIGCGDSYAQLISENKHRLPENVIAPYTHSSMLNDLTHKEKFYAMCDKADIDYPTTFVHRKKMGTDIKEPFQGPFVVKPSNGIEYWRHPFSKQYKVFKRDTWEEVLAVLQRIYESGYEDSVIVQDFIPGDDTYMRVLTNYSDKHGQVKMSCLGHVLLEEHTPHGIGNHAVIITEQNEELERKIKEFLDGMSFIGFSNLDIKYDQRDGKYKVLELNARQGRSNFYVTCSGANIAEYLVDDYILDKPLQYKSVSRKKLWLVVPKKLAFTYIRSEQFRRQMKQLIKEKKVINPLVYEPDNGFLRRLKCCESRLWQYIKFKRYLGNADQGTAD